MRVNKKSNKRNIDELNVKDYSAVSNLIYCLKCTLRHYPPLLLWCALAVLTNVLLPTLTTFLPKAVIDGITSHAPLPHLILTVLAFTVSLAVLTGLKHFLDKLIYWHKYKMNSFYVSKIAHKGMTTDYVNQEKESFRKLQTESFQSCNGNASDLTRIYDLSVELFSNILGFGVFLGILTSLNPLIVLFLIAATFVEFLYNKKIIRWANQNKKEKISYQQKTDYINRVSGELKSAKDIRLYSMSGWFEKIYQTNLQGMARWFRRYSAVVFKACVVGGGLSLLREATAYAYLLWLVLSSRISVANFVLYFGVITGFSGWLGGILDKINALIRIRFSVNYLRTYLDVPDKYQNAGGRETADILTLPKTIELRNVSYRYDGAEENALNNISLKISPGEHLAVVGLNGAGKTTLVKLICGLTAPTGGAVLYNGAEVKEYNRAGYYRLFSAVFQQYSILPVTIEEIVAENVPENIDSCKMEQSLKQAGLWEKVSSLENGVKSNFGKTIYDDGVEFSGGEIQKLLLARALYKAAPVMILDEPTAALDPLSESRLYETYHDIMKERSTIFISHRLASTRFCDRIVLLENGAVCEEGTHESLLLKKGRYTELFETQARYYRDNSGEGEGFDEAR